MRGTSGASLAAAQERFEPVLAQAGAQALAWGEQLFAVTAALDGSTTLRRVLADPSLDPRSKANVAGTLVKGQVSDPVGDVVAGLARSRWAHDKDLPDAAELLGLDAVFSSAQARGALETVEDELFRLSRALMGSREARQALSDDRVDPERRRALVGALVQDKADEATVVLAEHATVALRGRRFVPTLGWYGDIAAERRRRFVASVIVATAPTAAQLDRLSVLLTQAYGRAVQLNVTIDPSVLGGMRIRVGADVVDSTVLSRLALARRGLDS